MAIVVDANVVAALVLPLAYDALATRLFIRWRQQGERIIAPALMEYELVSIVRQGISRKQLRDERALPLLHRLLRFDIEIIVPTIELHLQAYGLATLLGHSKARDAQYVALAAREGAPLWTADRRLANAARAAGLAWVHWIGEEGG